MNRKRLALLILIVLSLSFPGHLPFRTPAQTADKVSFGALTEGQILNGFRTDAVYLNDSDKAWGAGLAYSNGFGASAGIGRIEYYAERTPELPQTLQFVIGEFKKAKPDPGLAEYAIAVAFSQFRSASQYEERGRAMADDIADGVPPEKVRRFRQGLLDLRNLPNLSDELFRRMPKVYARLRPGYGTKARDAPGASFMSSDPKNSLLPMRSISRA